MRASAESPCLTPDRAIAATPVWPAIPIFWAARCAALPRGPGRARRDGADDGCGPASATPGCSRSTPLPVEGAPFSSTVPAKYSRAVRVVTGTRCFARLVAPQTCLLQPRATRVARWSPESAASHPTCAPLVGALTYTLPSCCRRWSARVALASARPCSARAMRGREGLAAPASSAATLSSLENPDQRVPPSLSASLPDPRRVGEAGPGNLPALPARGDLPLLALAQVSTVDPRGARYRSRAVCATHASRPYV